MLQYTYIIYNIYGKIATCENKILYEINNVASFWVKGKNIRT